MRFAFLFSIHPIWTWNQGAAFATKVNKMQRNNKDSSRNRKVFERRKAICDRVADRRPSDREDLLAKNGKNRNLHGGPCNWRRCCQQSQLWPLNINQMAAVNPASAVKGTAWQRGSYLRCDRRCFIDVRLYYTWQNVANTSVFLSCIETFNRTGTMIIMASNCSCCYSLPAVLPHPDPIKIPLTYLNHPLCISATFGNLNRYPRRIILVCEKPLPSPFNLPLTCPMALTVYGPSFIIVRTPFEQMLPK